MSVSEVKPTNPEHFRKRLEQRRWAEWRFRMYGRMAISIATTVLILLVGSIILESRSAFSRYELQITIAPGSSEARVIHDAVLDQLEERFGGGQTGEAIRSDLSSMTTVLDVASMSEAVREKGADGKPLSVRVPVSGWADQYLKSRKSAGEWTKLDTYERAGNRLVLEETGVSSRADTSRPAEIVFLEDGGYYLDRLSDQDAQIDLLLPGTVPQALQGKVLTIRLPEAQRNISDVQIAALEILRADGDLERRFNSALFFRSDSSQPELAGLLAAMVGSILIIIVTMALALPVGVAAAIYLEEFAPRSAFTQFITANINNLAAVPSIVFGLLGAAVLINGVVIGIPFTEFAIRLGGGMGRGWPLVGGIVLALMTLPTVIIASRTAIAAVPDSLRAGALAMGASRLQMVSHHVLPSATPGIMTGSIIGLAQALGETAPLLLIGMFAFIGEVPNGMADRTNALPVLIYQWSTRSEIAFAPLTAAAIVILLLIMLAMNGLAVWIRMKFEAKR